MRNYLLIDSRCPFLCRKCAWLTCVTQLGWPLYAASVLSWSFKIRRQQFLAEPVLFVLLWTYVKNVKSWGQIAWSYQWEVFIFNQFNFYWKKWMWWLWLAANYIQPPVDGNVATTLVISVSRGFSVSGTSWFFPSILDFNLLTTINHLSWYHKYYCRVQIWWLFWLLFMIHVYWTSTYILVNMKIGFSNYVQNRINLSVTVLVIW